MPTDPRPVPAVPAVRPSLRLEPAPAAEANAIPRARALLSLGTTWKAPIDITGDLVGALAHVLWRARGGPDIDNWVDAERLLHSLLPASTPAIETKPAVPTPTSAVATPKSPAAPLKPAAATPAPTAQPSAPPAPAPAKARSRKS